MNLPTELLYSIFQYTNLTDVVNFNNINVLKLYLKYNFNKNQYYDNYIIYGKDRDFVEIFIQTGIKNGYNFSIYTWNFGMQYAASTGNKDLIQLFIQKGANRWKEGVYSAAKGGHKDLVDFFIQKEIVKNGIFTKYDWNIILQYASEGGNRDIINLCIQNGANNWTFGINGAAQGGHIDIVYFFIQKGMENGYHFSNSIWNIGYKYASLGGHKDLMELFKKKYEHKI